MRRWLLAAVIGATVAAMADDPNRIQLSLERNDKGVWQGVPANLVFAQNDRIRFRFSTNFDGYLYVMNQSTSGNYELLFPRQDTGEMNRIEAGKQYIVPATQGWFKVTGPPGYDVIYWVVSPIELGGETGYRLPPPPKAGSPGVTLHPRCDDTIFKARGDCVDNSAGPKQVKEGEKLPDNLTGIPGAASRELIFIQDKDRFIVSSPVPLKGPVIYEFRLAHR